MAKIVEGVAVIAGAVIATVLTGGAASPLLTLAWGEAILGAAVSIGASLTMAGIAQALTAGPSLPMSVRQPAAPRQIIYGQARVSGVIVYLSTTNNGHDLNHVIVWTTHQVNSIDALYLDGRQIHVPAGGGQDDGGTYFDDSGNSYSYGSTVHAFNSLGSTSGQWFSDLGGRDSKWDSGCTLNGMAATYLRCTYDPNRFASMPAVKATISGKNDIYDPRDGTHKYTNNAALVIADLLCNTDYGLGCNYATEIDEPQLIAAANLCDEQVTLANGGTESRYTLNGFFDTSSTPGDILDAMLTCCEGRISYTGGRWKIYPAAWYGSGLNFDQSALIGPVKWAPRRKYRDLINAVRATFVCPRYPYAQVGYDQDNKDSNIFSGEWQPTDIPEYAQDAGHGYVSDANLAADGIKLYFTRSYRFVTSVAMAQRLAKIYLMRNRQQGTGTLQMDMSAYQLQAQDIFQMTMPTLGWADKYLEVQTHRFVPKFDKGNNSAPVIYCEIDVCETDPSVYLWSTAEERGILNTASPTIYNAQEVNPPTNLVLESGADSAVIGADGVVIPRINITWIEPDDPFVLSGGYVEIQWQQNGAGTWASAGYFNANITKYFLTGVVTGQQYNVQIRAARSNSATSGWISAGPHTVSSQASSFSYTNVSGLGALATKNFVDFASGDVANRTATNLTYSTGLTVEALRPATPGADQTAGQSIDILADGTIYARIKATDSAGGYITGKSYGHNIVPNYSFELNHTGTAYGDEWSWAGDTASGFFFLSRETPSAPFVRSGAADILFRTVANLGPIPTSYVGAHLFSNPIPCAGNSNLFMGGWLRWDSNTAIPAGVSVLARFGVRFLDQAHNYLSEANIDTINEQSGGYQLKSGSAVAHPFTCFIQFQLAAFIQASSPGMSTPNGLIGDLRFDDVFCSIQAGSGLLNAQGSIIPNQPIGVSYSVSNSGCTISWSLQTMLRSDGTTLWVQAGSLTYSSLSSSTGYYAYLYVNVADGTIQAANGAPPPTSPSAVMAAQAGLDGRIPLLPIHFTTLDAGNGGTGGGTGGGNGTCPEASELVEVEGKGQIAVGAVQPGNRVKGYSFKTTGNVYRNVLQVATETCTAWRIVDGHKVTPCEPVYVNGQWTPAYRASKQQDTTQGTRVVLFVETDEYDEQNYMLVSGTPLIIHNGGILPC